ncbi:unnamed protein product [Scytosiphon promiscuus]
MADARGGSGGIEEELVGAAMQISTLRQELKRAKLDLDSAVQENEGLKTACDKSLRAIREQEAEREVMMTAHAKEVEDIKKNESDALETAQKACAELKKRDAEMAVLKAEVATAREAATAAAAAAAAAASAPATPINARRRVTATGAKPVGSGTGSGTGSGAVAEGGAEPVRAGGARYAMDEDGEGDADGKEAKKKAEGGDDEEEEEEDEEDDGDDDDDDDDDDDEGGEEEKGGGGFFGWLTGSARKKRRRGE